MTSACYSHILLELDGTLGVITRETCYEDSNLINVLNDHHTIDCPRVYRYFQLSQSCNKTRAITPPIIDLGKMFCLSL